MVDLLISMVIVVAGGLDDAFFGAIDLSRPDQLAYLSALTLATGVGGYVAGRMARVRQPMHGLLVGVVGVLYNQLAIWGGEPAPSHALVIASAIGCALGALGGLISMHADRK